jgi:hypothetical protein
MAQARRSSLVVVARQILIAALLGLISLLVLAVDARAQVTSNVLRRVLLIRAGASAGTAFTLEVDGKQYIVTARHVVAALHSQDTIHYRRGDNWVPLNVTILQHPVSSQIDVAVLVPRQQITINFPLEPTSAGALMGQDV